VTTIEILLEQSSLNGGLLSKEMQAPLLEISQLGPGRDSSVLTMGVE
jgi:hypothetical protein